MVSKNKKTKKKNNSKNRSSLLKTITRKLNRNVHCKSKKLKKNYNHKSKTKKVKKMIGGKNPPNKRPTFIINEAKHPKSTSNLFYLGKSKKTSSKNRGSDRERDFFINLEDIEKKPKNNTFQLVYYEPKADGKKKGEQDITHIEVDNPGDDFDSTFYNGDNEVLKIKDGTNIANSFYEHFFRDINAGGNRPIYSFMGNTRLQLNFIYNDTQPLKFNVIFKNLKEYFKNNNYNVSLINLLIELEKINKEKYEERGKKIKNKSSKNVSTIENNKGKGSLSSGKKLMRLKEEYRKGTELVTQLKGGKILIDNVSVPSTTTGMPISVEIIGLEENVIPFFFKNLQYINLGDNKDDKKNNIYYLELNIELKDKNQKSKTGSRKSKKSTSSGSSTKGNNNNLGRIIRNAISTGDFSKVPENLLNKAKLEHALIYGNNADVNSDIKNRASMIRVARNINSGKIKRSKVAELRRLSELSEKKNGSETKASKKERKLQFKKSVKVKEYNEYDPFLDIINNLSSSNWVIGYGELTKQINELKNLLGVKFEEVKQLILKINRINNYIDTLKGKPEDLEISAENLNVNNSNDAIEVNNTKKLYERVIKDDKFYKLYNNKIDELIRTDKKNKPLSLYKSAVTLKNMLLEKLESHYIHRQKMRKKKQIKQFKKIKQINYN